MKTLFISLMMALTSASAQQQATKVYTSPNGKKYHTHADCQYIKGHNNVKTITLKQAQAEGKELCARCQAKDNKPKKN